MNTPPPGAEEDALDAVLARYLEDRDAGRPVSRQELLDRHPEFARELEAFFEDDEQMAVALGPAGFRGPRRFGDYELLEEIGRGGMGVVYRARDLRLGRIVALKMILAGPFAADEEVRRFLVEARNASNLEHPNIVPVYDVACHAGQAFYTMRLMEKGPLSKQLDRYVRDPRAAADLVATVARAIHHAHRHGLLHRDLKPANILLGADGCPMVADFGLARRLDGGETLTEPGALVGCPPYMAPEQARGEKGLTVATDVYGLGAVLYELLTGRPPFRSASSAQTLKDVQEREPARPSAAGRKVDRDLETVCLKCLEKAPADRYRSAEALADDLGRWLRHEPVEARAAGPVLRLRRWARRNPAIAAALVTLATSLVVVSSLLHRVSKANAHNRDLVVQLGVAVAQERATAERERREKLANEQLVKDVRQVVAEELREMWRAEGAEFVPVSSEKRAILTRSPIHRPAAGDGTTRVTLAVKTHEFPEAIAEKMTPLLTLLERRLTAQASAPVLIDLRVYNRYRSAVRAMVRGEVEFVRAGPPSYVEIVRGKPGVRLQASEAVDGRGVIFVRADAGIDGEGTAALRQLRGRRFAFGNSNSTYGNHYAKVELLNADLRAEHLAGWKSHLGHDEVVEAVASGAFDAGAAKQSTVEKAIAAGRPLRIVHRMGVDRVSFAWVCREDVPQPLADVFRSALLSADAATLTPLKLKGLQPVADRDYDDVRRVMDAAKEFGAELADD